MSSLDSANSFIDIYCERTEIGLLAEPINALTNLAFYISAFFIYLLIKRENRFDLASVSLLFLVVAIGTGSTLFHTFATPWAMLCDTIPILLFQLFFIYFYGSKVIGFNQPKALFLFLSFLIITAFFGLLPQSWLNGSIGYMPALIFLGGLGIYHIILKKQEPYILLLCAAVFCLSLTFRTMDMASCEAFPIGVHFMWHILNGLVLYLAMRSFIVGQRKN